MQSLSGCKDKQSSSSKDIIKSNETLIMSGKTVKDMILIPSGEFIMGNNMKDKKSKSKRSSMLRKPMYIDEFPERKVFLEAYYIDKYEVTNEQYKKMVDAVGLKSFPDHWKNGNYPEGKAKHPVVYVNWYDVIFYAKWAKKRIPTESEWEKAARGTDGRLWTWGNNYDPTKGNFGLNEIKDTTPIGSFIEDKSPFGLFDVTGNVKEWTVNWYQPYPDNDFEFADFGKKYKVVRGSSHIKYGHYYDKSFAMVTHRFSLDPRYAMGDVGFRTVISKSGQSGMESY